MAKKPTPQIAGHDEGARLTPKEAAALADSWANSWLNDDESIGDFLLLLRSVAYAADLNEREGILFAVENAVLPFSPQINRATDRLISQRLTVAHSLIKEGGTQ
jgi:hypothetical protein